MREDLRFLVFTAFAAGVLFIGRPSSPPGAYILDLSGQLDGRGDGAGGGRRPRIRGVRRVGLLRSSGWKRGDRGYVWHRRVPPSEQGRHKDISTHPRNPPRDPFPLPTSPYSVPSRLIGQFVLVRS